jgi:hypothetical protein
MISLYLEYDVVSMVWYPTYYWLKIKFNHLDEIGCTWMMSSHNGDEVRPCG